MKKQISEIDLKNASLEEVKQALETSFEEAKQEALKAVEKSYDSGIRSILFAPSVALIQNDEKFSTSSSLESNGCTALDVFCLLDFFNEKNIEALKERVK